MRGARVRRAGRAGASELARDVRHDHPYGVFRFAHIPVATAWAGDVHARSLVRWLEVRRSLEFAFDQLAAVPRGEPSVTCGPPQPDELVVALQEGWRGEIAHVVVTDDKAGSAAIRSSIPPFTTGPH